MYLLWGGLFIYIYIYIHVFLGIFFFIASVTVNKTPTECFTCYKRTQTLPVCIHTYFGHWSLFTLFSHDLPEQFVVCHVSQWWKGKILCLIWDGGQQTKILCRLSPALGEGPMTTLRLPRQMCVTLSKWSSTICSHEQKSIHKISWAFHKLMSGYPAAI